MSVKRCTSQTEIQSLSSMTFSLLVLVMNVMALTLSASIDSGEMPFHSIDPCPCSVTTTEHDVIVDCANKKLDHLEAEWFPLNTTSLNLEGNLLDSIPDGIFENCSQLKTLNLNNNTIKTIMPRAFLGLRQLENLFLGMNKLDICDDRFPVSAFERLENLKVLDLLQRLPDLLQCLPFDKDKYCYGFIGNIVGLTSLSIDTRGKHVYFGEEFQNLTNLEKLKITGNAEIIADDSFKYLWNLKYLEFNTLYCLINVNVSINFLVPLVKLDQLFMIKISIGTEYMLSLLHPFMGRNMTTIHLSRVSNFAPWLARENDFKDEVLDANKTTTLRRICVSDFTLTDSFLYYLEMGALASDTWDRCLRNLDLSFNPWQGNEVAFAMLLRIKNLRSIVITDKKESCFNTQFPMAIITPLYKDSTLSQLGFSGFGKRKKFPVNLWESQYSRNEFSWYNNRPLSKDRSFNKNRKKTFNLDFHKPSSSSESIIVWIPETLAYIDFSRLIDVIWMSMNISIIGAQNFEFLDITNSGFELFTGKIEGLTGLKTLIASENRMSILSPSFFDTFPAIETLAVANCGFELNFIATQGTRFLSSLKKLKSLDLSSNSLSILAPDMFRPNTNLTELSLSGNRFSTIPFRLTDTPKLARLDIRYNAFPTLQQKITEELDSLAQKWGKFELFLDGNILSCACQNIKFLQWLRLTAVTLDLGGNFTCINEQGALTYTYAYTDLEVFWRQCSGQFYFYISLILFCVIAIGFLCAFVINKYRTFFISQLLGIFFGFRQHVPGDYRRGVFLAYEDKDYPFVIHHLLRFIEQRLGMATYIRDRDLEPGVMLGEAIADAIASCWRSVIIINQDFQDSSEYFQFTCRSAVSMINFANPFRVLVIVTERYRHRIPRDILSAIQEDNIVVVERFEIDGALQQILRNRLTR